MKNIQPAAWIYRIAVNVLFPRCCPVCGEIVQPEGALICPDCIGKLSPVRQPACRKCGKELFAEHMEYCLDCTRHRRTFDSGASLLNYNEAAKHSMAAVKYKNKREYLDFYAEAMNFRFAKLVTVWHPDALVPVPIHPSRMKKRGFNQAEELARRLSVQWDVPVASNLLVRTRKTAPQRDLNSAERLKNLQEAFAVSSKVNHMPVPRCVILIDDIYTTGSTIEACSRILKNAGVQTIHFLTICIGQNR